MIDADLSTTETTIATITYEGFTFEYDITVREIDFAFISQPADKLEYTVGDEFDPTGTLLYVVYTNEDEEEISEGFTFDYGTFTEAGTITVTLTYGSYTEEFTVEVIGEEVPVVLESITVTAPTKTTYTVGDTLDLTGMVVTANYSDGSTADVTATAAVDTTVLGTVGTATVTVTFEDKSATFTVTVEAVPVVLETITVTAPTKTTYTEGDTIDLAGMVVTANYSDGSTADVTTAATVDASVLNTVGTVTVTVTYEGKSATFTVTVEAKVVEPEEPEDIASGSIADTEITWAISADGVLTVSGTGAIPNYTSSTYAPWRAHLAKITSIVVEDGITRIGAYAFNTLANVTSITVADSVTEIGGYAFRRIDKTEEITINGVVMLEYGALMSTTAFKRITVSEKLHDIRGKAFPSGATIVAPTNSYADKYVQFAPTTASWGSTVISFESNGTATRPVVAFGSAGDTAFYAVFYANKDGSQRTAEISGLGKVKNYAYHESAKNVAADVNGTMFSPFYYMRKTNFADVKKILTLKVHDGLTNIGNYLFYGMNKAKTVEIGSGVTEIGCNVFWACPELDNVVIPEGVTAIKRNVFNGCSKLKSLTLPSTLTEIGTNIFIKAVPAQITVTTTSKLAIDYLTEFYPTVTIVQK